MGKGKKKAGGAGGKMRASHILMKKHSELLKVRDMLGGKDFKTLAREYSECSSKNKGGDLGWFTSGAMVQEFEKAVKSMSVGAISDPVKTQFGWHLIKRTG
ncbi:MAG: peptidylprolyl isomerase [archaeon]|nr:peptidylprolyl isomerase [archaeon]